MPREMLKQELLKLLMENEQLKTLQQQQGQHQPPQITDLRILVPRPFEQQGQEEEEEVDEQQGQEQEEEEEADRTTEDKKRKKMNNKDKKRKKMNNKDKKEEEEDEGQDEF